MKNTLTFLLILVFQQTFACVCGNMPLIDRVGNSDFIAEAKILKITADKENEGLHDIEIEIIELFKGENISKLKIYSALNSSCGFYTPENTNWLIFATKDKNGKLTFGYCSGAKQIDRKFDSDRFPNAQKGYNKSIQQKLDLLQYLKENKINPINEFELRISSINGCLKEFKGLEVKDEPFALYELTIDKDLSIIHVQALKEFDNDELKVDLLKCISENVKVYTRKKVTEIDKQTKIIFALYHYPAEQEHESFIGQFNL